MRLPTHIVVILVSCCAVLSAADDISPLSDDFSTADSLSSWQRINVVEGWNADQLERCAISDGHLVLEPYTSSWYQDWRGVLLFKDVSGDVLVSASIATSNRAGSGAPGRPFSLCGLMLRAPRPGLTPATWAPRGENYVFLSHGTADKPGTWQYEIKTTQASRSQLAISPAPAGHCSIAVARLGADLILLRRDPGGSWLVHGRYHRPDLPDSLQIGLTVYTDWPNVKNHQPRQHNGMVIRDGQPDLRATVDAVRFQRPPADLSVSLDDGAFAARVAALLP